MYAGYPGAYPPDPYAMYGAPPAVPYGGYGAPPPGMPYPQGDEVSTIYISGFPQDAKERELNNLLRFMHGYTACQMHYKADGPQGFAMFENAVAARAAISLVSSVQFDENCALRAEMARKNMFARPDETSACKRPKYAHSNFDGSAPKQNFSITAGPPEIPVAPQGFASITNQKDNAPCSTLFIGNLGDGVSETELQGLFGSQPGFVQLKIVRGTRAITCFAEYADLSSAMAVHQQLQGAIIASSDRGGIRIQYSKSPFGKRKGPPTGDGY